MASGDHSKKRTLVIVVQRYGADIVGGAEAHARMVAERLAADESFAVQVWTTTSRDFRTWDNFYPAGTSCENEVMVRRFPCERGRAPWFKLIHALLKLRIHWKIALPDWLEERLERHWYLAQGPFCPQLLTALATERERIDRFLFFTYLYHPSAFGLPLVADRACLVPTAHDEAALHTRTSLDLFRAARHLLVNSAAERRLLINLDAQLEHKIRIAGVGMDVPSDHTPPAKSRAKPYALYMGRIGRSKRLDLLLAAHRQLRASGQAPWELWLAGALDGDVNVQGREGVRYLGFIDEAHKKELLRDAAFIVNPSEHESLSLLVLEAVAAHKPVLLNRRCPIFRDYARLIPTVALYDHTEELGAQAQRILATDWRGSEARSQLAAAHAWLSQNYSWESVLSQYRAALA